MKFKDEVIAKIDLINENVEATKLGMEKRTVAPEKVYETLEKVIYELNTIKTLVNRE